VNGFVKSAEVSLEVISRDCQSKKGFFFMRTFFRDDIEKFQDYGILIPNRTIYFGSESYDEDEGCEESGVDFESAKKVIKNLIYLDNKSDEAITLYWNSPGGDWNRGMAIYDVILGLRSPVIMVGLGMVRSMGTIIMQACKKRFLSPNCDFMIHDGEEANYGESKTFEAWGNYSKLSRIKMYEIFLKKIRKKHTDYTIKKIEQLCTHDCIMTGQEAVDLGLADKVLK